MKLPCSKLVWNVQALGQIAPICVCLWMRNWLCNGKKKKKKLFKSQQSCVSVYNSGVHGRHYTCDCKCLSVCEKISVYFMRSVVCVCAVVIFARCSQSLLVQASSSVIVGCTAAAWSHKATCNNSGVFALPVWRVVVDGVRCCVWANLPNQVGAKLITAAFSVSVLHRVQRARCWEYTSMNNYTNTYKLLCMRHWEEDGVWI